MEIYFILLLVLLFNILLEITFKNIRIFDYRIKSRNISFIVCFLFILSIGIFRHEELGVDVINYRSYFLNLYPNFDMKFFILNPIYDPGYVLLNKTIALFTRNFRIFEVIVFCITFVIFSIIIYKDSKYPALSFLIYSGLEFIGFNMCILRQAIACSLCFLAFRFLEKNKLINYFILVLLAITFHKTAVFFYLTYVLSYNRKKSTSFESNIIYLILFYLGFRLILPKIYNLYSNNYSNVAVSGEGIKLLFFYSFILLFIGVLLKKNKVKSEIMKYESSFGAIYIQMGAISFSLFTRVTNYFSILFTLSIPNIVYESKYRRLYIIIFTSIFSALYIYGLFNNGLGVVPYKSFM